MFERSEPRNTIYFKFKTVSFLCFWVLLIFCSSCRLWTPIDGEFDDYIVNPKGSGYQVRITWHYSKHNMHKYFEVVH
jgi:hypothetical protein